MFWSLMEILNIIDRILRLEFFQGVRKYNSQSTRVLAFHIQTYTWQGLLDSNFYIKLANLTVLQHIR